MEKIVDALDRSAAVMNVILRYICVALLFVMMILGTADVVGRYLFNSPVWGTFEMFGILLAAIVLLGLSYTQSARAHVAVEVVTSRLSKKGQTIAGMVTGVIALAVTALIFIEGLKMVLLTADVGVRIQTIRLPLWIPQILLPVGALAMAYVLFIQVLQSILQLKKGS